MIAGALAMSVSACGGASVEGASSASRPAVASEAGEDRVAHVECRAPGPMGGRGGGHGHGHGHGHGRGMGGMPAHEDAHWLLDRHASIQRRVEYHPWGVETWTTSNDPEVAARLLRHASDMRDRMRAGLPIRRMDPLFERLRVEAPHIELEVEPISGGVHAVHRGQGSLAVALVHAHARTVELFVRDGRAEAHRCHDVPATETR